MAFDPREIIFDEAVILIADDVKHNRSYLRDALSDTNLKIFEAENGEEALSLTRKLIPDLIITDIKMPVLGGFELLEIIKSDNALEHIPVIAYSASVMNIQKDIISQGAFACLLIKPVLISELYTALMKYIPYKSAKLAVQLQSDRVNNNSDEITDLQGLIHSLDNQFKDIWMTFEIIQPIGVVRGFGEKLARLGTDHNSVIVTGYGEELIRAADSFNIDTILKLLGKFKSIVNSFKEQTKNIS
jgi:CheY-like chemotaxis protein